MAVFDEEFLLFTYVAEHNHHFCHMVLSLGSVLLTQLKHSEPSCLKIPLWSVESFRAAVPSHGDVRRSTILTFMKLDNIKSTLAKSRLTH